MHHSIKPKKSLGQHFLKDANIVRKITAAIPAKADEHVIEIGPGTGALTEYLLESYKNLTAIEIDQRAVEVLNERFPNLRLIQKDILKTDWYEVLGSETGVHVVGNLPYYITSQILFNVMDQRKRFKSAIFMMQKEVAQRLIAEPHTKDYGILSVQVQLMSTPEILFDVSRNSFYPPPNVESSVVKLTFDKADLNCSDTHLKTVVRTAFNQRRKKLSNSLKPVFDVNLVEGFDFDKRAEAWEPREYEKLTAHLEQVGIIH
jgi:16S rRNA (adenine1518-N6/adenine1519-N6)-dimethyltransferase